MLTSCLTILISFMIVNLFGWAVHWGLHQKWSGSFGRSHKVHHFRLYPVKDFLSDDYRDAGKDATPKFFVLLAFPMLAGVVMLWGIGFLSLLNMILSLSTMISVGLLDNWFHDLFHLKSHWVMRVPVLKSLFENWRRLHFLHHVKVKKNFGIFNFWWDRMLGSFWKKDLKWPWKKDEEDGQDVSV